MNRPNGPTVPPDLLKYLEDRFGENQFAATLAASKTGLSPYDMGLLVGSLRLVLLLRSLAKRAETTGNTIEVETA